MEGVVEFLELSCHLENFVEQCDGQCSDGGGFLRRPMQRRRRRCRRGRTGGDNREERTGEGTGAGCFYLGQGKRLLEAGLAMLWTLMRNQTV